jgi:NAD+ diphosphatase
MGAGNRRVFRSSLSEPTEGSSPALWFAFRNRELLVAADSCLPPGKGLERLGLQPLQTHYLGLLENVRCYAAELPPETRPPEGMAFRDLRSLLGRLEWDLHELAGRAIQIVEWDRNHRYCGACGTPTEIATAERSRACPQCGLSHFPRIAPSMIVAVEREDAILLARSPHFPPGIYSVLAGFLEPGESAEDAVVREVYEETRIEVTDIEYFDSQPWPFPHSLMLGFQARYAAGEIQVDGAEVEVAGWYPADDMPMIFPGNVSIAQWLIRDFLERHR